MTQKPLDEMTPEEIRIEIAEWKGFSYGVVAHSWGVQTGNTPTPIYGFTRDMHIAEPPNWPGDISDAWELAKEIEEKYTISIKLNKGCASVVIYDCGNGDPEDEYAMTFISSGRAETAPLAICRAWLAWKLSESNV